MTIYYNEIDKNAAAWLRNLISAGHIAPGIVDERSIEDVVPTELMGYTQCHFFAGIGVWSHALRSAGWPDARPVWTGSCPCQPFSAAGKGAGFDDQRHLWPAFQHLISQCRPEFVLGEQVASKDADPWIDLVHTDLEALGYAFGAVAFPSAGVGAPHIRDRTYWVADASSARVRAKGLGAAGTETPGVHGFDRQREWLRPDVGAMHDSEFDRLADTRQHHRGSQAEPAHHQQPQGDRPADWAGGCGISLGGLADSDGGQCEQQPRDGRPAGLLGAAHGTPSVVIGLGDCGAGAGLRPSPVNGFWRVADWLGCRDDKWRAVEPGTFPLVAGLPRSMGQMPPELRRLAKMAGLDSKSLARAKSYRIAGLKGYGNAINAQAAQAFVEAVMESAA